MHEWMLAWHREATARWREQRRNGVSLGVGVLLGLGVLGGHALRAESVLTDEPVRQTVTSVTEQALKPPQEDQSAQSLMDLLQTRYRFDSGSAKAFLGGPYLLSYERALFTPTPMKVHHLLYAWGPEKARLELTVLEGVGKNSVSILDGKRALLRVDGTTTAVGADELKTKLQTYRLRSLLKLQVDLLDQLKALLGGLEPAYQGTLSESDGAISHVLGTEPRGARPPVQLWVEDKSGNLRRVAYGVGRERVEFRYSDFRLAFPGVSVPFRMEFWRAGQLEDVVKIRRLEVLARQDERWMEREGKGGGG